MAFNLFGSLPKEDAGKKTGQNILVLPVKNKNEKIKEKAASDAGIIDLNKGVKNNADQNIAEKTEAKAEKEPEKAEENKKQPDSQAEKQNSDTKEAKENVAAAAEDEITQAAFNPGSVKLNKVRDDFSVQFKDEEWAAKKEELEKRVLNIRIEPDINLGSVRVLLASCTNIYSELKREQRTNKTFYGVLTDKNTGLIQRQQAINAFGKNSEDRKKNSYLSCEQFKMKDKGTEYNLYDLSMIVQDRIDTINDLLDDVKQKKETLISFLAVLKLESGMVK